jgi:hypothetical protein
MDNFSPRLGDRGRSSIQSRPLRDTEVLLEPHLSERHEPWLEIPRTATISEEPMDKPANKMDKPANKMDKPANKKVTGVAGSFLLVLGAVGICFTMFQQTNPGMAILIGLFSFCVAAGTGIGTAVSMSKTSCVSEDDTAR